MRRLRRKWLGGLAAFGRSRWLPIIAAVVIGGGSLSGGRGSILGTLTGALIMQVISSGRTALKLRNPVQEILIGLIIIAAVTIDQIRRGQVRWRDVTHVLSRLTRISS